MEHIPASRLAELPATQWEQAKRRVAVVRHYLEEGDTSLAAVIRHASALGIGRGMFYRLVRTVKSWDECPSRPRSRRPRAFADARAAAAASEAVDRAGSAAILEDALRTAIEIAAEKGAEPPSERAIRRAHGDVRAGPAIAERIGMTEDFAIDAAALAVKVRAPDGTPLPAVLTAVVDTHVGDLLAWQATAGEADGEAVVGLLFEARRRSAEARTIAVSSGISADARPMISGIGHDVVERRIPAGYVLKAALGSRIGRIALLPRLLSRGGGDDLPLVEIEDLRAVIEELLAAMAEEAGRS